MKAARLIFHKKLFFIQRLKFNKRLKLFKEKNKIKIFDITIEMMRKCGGANPHWVDKENDVKYVTGKNM